ncbi:MAG: hypothetical protein LBN96_04680 [Desulfovibrio sp.]|jgi:hypothetical protein|nr:hypothetical protein [Desulfovibrio sp.]
MKTSCEHPGNAPRKQAILFFGACFLIPDLGLPLRSGANDADNGEKEVWNMTPSSPRALSSVKAVFKRKTK